jgi:hypothetical protein
MRGPGEGASCPRAGTKGDPAEIDPKEDHKADPWAVSEDRPEADPIGLPGRAKESAPGLV